MPPGTRPFMQAHPLRLMQPGARAQGWFKNRNVRFADQSAKLGRAQQRWACMCPALCLWGRPGGGGLGPARELSNRTATNAWPVHMAPPSVAGVLQSHAAQERKSQVAARLPFRTGVGGHIASVPHGLVLDSVSRGGKMDSTSSLGGGSGKVLEASVELERVLWPFWG